VTQAEVNEEKSVRYLAMEKDLAEVKAALSEAVEKTNSKSGEIESLLKTVESLNANLSEAQVYGCISTVSCLLILRELAGIET